MKLRIRTTVVAFLLIATPALATDFSVVLREPGTESTPGTSIVDDLSPGAANKPCGEDGAKACLTLGMAIYRALNAPYTDETPPITPEEKFHRGQLAFKIKNAKEDKLTAEDTALAKRLLAKLYGPLVVYATWSLLDPATAK